MELGLGERIDLGKTKRDFKEGAGLYGKGGTGLGITGRGRRKGKEFGKGNDGARLEARSDKRDRIWGGAEGCWGVKGPVYGKMGFRSWNPVGWRRNVSGLRFAGWEMTSDRTGLCQVTQLGWSIIQMHLGCWLRPGQGKCRNQSVNA